MTHRASLTWRRRRAMAMACCGIALTLVGVLVVSIANRSSAASPPAELISVPPPIAPETPPTPVPGSSLQPAPTGFENIGPSLSADGGIVAFSQEPNTSDASYVGFDRGLLRDRDPRTTTPVPVLAGSTGEQHGTVVSRDGCFTVTYTETQFDDPRTPMIEGWNRCVPSAAPTTIPVDFGRLMDLSQTEPGASFQADFVYGLAISSHGRFVAMSARLNTDSPTQVDGSVWIDRDADGNGILDEANTNSLVKTRSNAILDATLPSLGDENSTPLVAVSYSNHNDCTCTATIQLWNPTISNSTSVRIVSVAAGTSDTPADLASTEPSMSPDGRFIAFSSNATNLVTPSIVVPPTVPPSTPKHQIYVRDMTTSAVAMVSRVDSAIGNADSELPSITADGTQIAFGTHSNNLLPGYELSQLSSSIHDDGLVARSTSGFFATVAFDRVDLAPDGSPLDITDSDDSNDAPVISSNGRYAAWSTTVGDGLGADEGTSRTNVFAIARPAVLTGSSVDFGGVLVGQTTAAQPVTITNTGLSSVLPASITSSSGEFTVTGGTCALNVYLSPGASCTVTVTFSPADEGARSTQIVLAEGGFAAVSVTSIVTGIGTVPATTTTSTTSTTTTTARTTTTTRPRVTTTTTTTTTTVAKVQSLVITPNPGAFPVTVIGSTSAPVDFFVSSSGTAAVPVTSVAIDGVAPTDYAITADTCTGARLAPSGTCQVSVVVRPIAGGPRPATLTVASATTSASADLTATGAFQPVIRLSPNVIPVERVAIAIGTGFAPSMVVQLQWSTGTRTFDASTDAAGSFALQIPIGPDEPTGPRTLTALEQPGVFPSVSTPALIIDGTMQPPGGINPAFDTMTVLVIRG